MEKVGGNGRKKGVMQVGHEGLFTDGEGGNGSGRKKGVMQEMKEFCVRNNKGNVGMGFMWEMKGLCGK